MKILLSTILLLTTLQTYAQFDYELLMVFLDQKSLGQNSELSSSTEFQLDRQGRQTKTLIKQFNKQGLPIALIQFGPQGQLAMKKEFAYGPSNDALKIVIENLPDDIKPARKGTADN